MNGEQRGHDGEAGSNEHGACVVSTNADDRQCDRGDRGDERADADADEVHLPAEHDHPVAVEQEQPSGQQRAETDQREHRDQPVAEEEPHRRCIGCADCNAEGPSAYPDWGKAPKSGSAGSSPSIRISIGQRHSPRSMT